MAGLEKRFDTDRIGLKRMKRMNVNQSEMMPVSSHAHEMEEPGEPEGNTGMTTSGGNEPSFATDDGGGLSFST